MKQRQHSRIATTGSDDLVVYVSTGKVMRMTLVGVALTLVVGIGALLGPTELSGYRGSLVVRLLVLFFGLPMLVVVTVRTFLLIFSSAPRLVVSHEGIWVNSPLLFGTGTVPWSEITGMLAIRYQLYKQSSLLIRLRDKRTLRARQNAVQVLLYLLTGNPLIWPKAIVVNDAWLAMSIAELVGRMKIRYGSELARHGIQVQGDAG